ncbi:two-component system regulatory protein YycI [Ferdinandcohnia quinoae]|uniref:Two-component system regulatory protein YycI n=1 Tax=Fredinandcohnia quinoae TaxID=2918902 RepID=A0AAW5E306_9BACI|nr:two-component system regulatory protein YycI [Fredinandcohnia sp. SECRCQ15]MCH1626758.1 two-component system regulatory protein YycI [Fredinandcohnia sp. SECRCQ15]
MDWSKTQTLFIITFLVLNVFLGYQLIEKKNSSQLDLLKELSIDEQLAGQEITYEPLPKEPKEGTYISGKIKLFTKEDVEKLKNQEVNYDSGALLQGVFKEPIKLLSLKDDALITQVVKENIISGDSYEIWKVDEELGRIILFQHYKNQVIFNQISSVDGMAMVNQFINLSGVLVLNFNKNHEIVSYQQTLLTDFKEFEKEEIQTPIKTLGILLGNGHLKWGSHVSKMEIGYYPLVPLSESQVLTPTWHIVVDDKKDIYVNAIEGQIIEKTE